MQRHAGVPNIQEQEQHKDSEGTTIQRTYIMLRMWEPRAQFVNDECHTIQFSFELLIRFHVCYRYVACSIINCRIICVMLPHTYIARCQWYMVVQQQAELQHIVSHDAN